ncbi:MAG TPA: 3-deoxy-D-manno-octulosonic acid transferase [Methylophilaceae bacterium]|jgi:3-deoxy-D-manno-octulosonic-acid transferase|nr:3-deoxy-D-manno-octulosonic acid transferase [Methylophilaceae bacterium]|tara:strand:+ start:10535 stop:11800 length:1266 start_codon:yes stop_codon:yes gene_type:complete
MMNLFLYNLIISLLLPFALIRLLYRGLIQPEYLNFWHERLGWYFRKDSVWSEKNTLWLHCVSVGETKAALPLIKMVIKDYPDINILLTHGTLTGRRVAIDYSDRIHRCYLPFDLKWAVKNFLDHYQPRMGLILETEIWPNLIDQCCSQKIPLFLINARLSEKSLRSYAPYKKIISEALSKLKHIYVQSTIDKINFSNLTEQPISIMGNLKFDARPPEDIAQKTHKLKAQLKIKKEFVIVVSSTRDGEEAVILKLFKKINLANALVIIIPRHPERFSEVEKLFDSYQLPYRKRSDLKNLISCPHYVLGDSMGELYEYYGLASLVIMGGSIKNFGSQNIIEPMLLNRPIAVGPSIFNFKHIVEISQKEGLVYRFRGMDELEEIILQLMNAEDLRKRIAIKTSNFIERNSGASKKILQLINQYF